MHNKMVAVITKPIPTDKVTTLSVLVPRILSGVVPATRSIFDEEFSGWRPTYLVLKSKSA